MTENETVSTKSWKEWLPLLVLPALLLVGEGMALLMIGPVQESGATAFQDPQSVWNPFIFLAMILIFTGILLLLMRYNLNWVISGFIAFSVFAIFVFVANTLLSVFFGPTDPVAWVSLLLGVVVTVALYKYPEWHVIDIAGLLMVAGVGALFGTSIGIIPAILLLVILATYDAISVYRTKHMLKLAGGILNLKLPTIMFLIPKKRDFSYRKLQVTQNLEVKDPNQKRDAYILGAGDIIIPTVLVVSARVFQPSMVPVLGAVLGSLAGMLLLLTFLGGGKAQAGLPPLNSGTIIGFLVGCALVGSWGWLTLA